MLKHISLLFGCFLFGFSLMAQPSNVHCNYKALVLNEGSIDTVIIVDSTERVFMIQTKSDGAMQKIKKDEAFQMLSSENINHWVKFRFEDDYLVDDVFIHAKVLGYNESRLLLEYDYNNLEAIASVHKSQIAVKNLKEFESAIQSVPIK